MPDELHQPLGLDPAPDAARVGVRRVSPRFVVWSTLGAMAATAGVYAARHSDANGGNPRVVAKIETIAPPAPAPAPVAHARDPSPTGTIDARKSERQTAAEIERESGVKVTRTGGGAAPGALIIQLDQPSGVHLAPAPDRRLVERDRLGPLPRIGPDGAKPWQVYARPLVLSQKLKPGAPRIALIVGGLGLSPTTTQAALDKLPADVSFAFAPYGDDLASEVASARDAGHEAFLQAPMEPFDYPRNNPGPHTLTVKSADDGNVDLRWLMTRFSGYVGIVNFLGARFTSDEAAMKPFMRQLAERGVAYIDDGTAPQSLAAAIGPTVGAATARADLTIDSDMRPDAIEAALGKLEAIARQKGFAMGVASAVPQSIDHVARFARSLEGRGIALVPASAALSTEAAPQAEARRP
ncbi:MAG: divergent polysaccharide deacetylase family protein [Hyphomicrobiales bacterium]|nr:divergent polysaccharide deacetylase family protein [Hyphomicrobiales bacterium]